MLQRFVTVAGARGGHGTSTAAAVLALYLAAHMPTNLVAADPESEAVLLGLPSGDGRHPADVTPTLKLSREVDAAAELVVINAGALADTDRRWDADAQAPFLVVLRGPCYLGLRSLLTSEGRPPDGVILVREHGRSLRRHDVEEVLGVRVVAEVDQSHEVARVIDAGLLVSRLHRLREFRSLRRLAADIVAERGIGAAA